MSFLLFTKCLQIHIHQVLMFCVLDIITYLKLCASNKMSRVYFLKFFVLNFVPSSVEPLPPILMKLIFLYSPSSFSEQYILLLILFCCFPNHCGMKDLPRLKWVSHDLGPHLGLLLLYVTIRYRKWCLVIVIIDFIFRNYACISFLQCSINNLANSEGIST